jgi:hypothetical protein
MSGYSWWRAGVRGRHFDNPPRANGCLGHLAINLTISLHATMQEVRQRLIPGSRKHDVGEVVARALSWADRHNRVVTFAYIVLPGVNDARADMDRLAAMLAGRRARVNLMRWNPVAGVDLGRTPDRSLALFRRSFERAGVPVAVRDTQDRDIRAACGQLWLRDARGAPLRRERAGGGCRLTNVRTARDPLVIAGPRVGVTLPVHVASDRSLSTDARPCLSSRPSARAAHLGRGLGRRTDGGAAPT